MADSTGVVVPASSPGHGGRGMCPGRIIGGLIVALAVIGSTMIMAKAIERVRSDNSIQITGSAKRRIRSDLIIWTAQVTTQAPTMSAAYKSLAASLPKVTSFLEKKGIPKTQVVVSAVSIRRLHPHDKDGRELQEQVSGYAMDQTVEVRSPDVDKVAQVAREATQLIEEGVELESRPPEFHYTKLGELKIQMLAEAAKDSRVRAEQIASSTGAKIGPVRSARMGVIQINAADSTDVSNEGNNDTSSIDKDILTVVAATFALE